MDLKVANFFIRNGTNTENNTTAKTQHTSKFGSRCGFAGPFVMRSYCFPAILWTLVLYYYCIRAHIYRDFSQPSNVADNTCVLLNSLHLKQNKACNL